MTFREKNIIISLITLVIVFVAYSIIMFNMHLAGVLVAPEANVILGKSVLILMAVSIVVVLVVSTTFGIGHAVRTKTKEGFVIDERDALIELKGWRISFIAFGLGFICAMILLALAVPAFQVLFFIVCSMFISNVIGDIAKIYLYRKGV